MTERDIEKVICAGFSVLRADRFRLRIKIRNHQRSWKTLEKNFTSAAALDRRFEELLQHPKNIEG